MRKLWPSKRACLLSTILVFAGCETLPALVQLGVSFGNDMISAAAHNYTPQYADQVESLLSGIASNITGLQFGAQSADDLVEQENASDVDSPNADVFEETLDSTLDTEVAGTTLATNLLVWRSGATHLSQIKDGDRLFGSGSNSQAGDKLKIHFKTNCECYVYVIGVDSTGYVAQIFPDADEQLTNPVSQGRDYVLPGDDYWWGLDQTTGVEHVYFIVSREPRDDIEAALAALIAQPRRAITDELQPVREPVLLNTRGLVKVFAPNSTLPLQSLSDFESSKVSTPVSSEVFTSRNLSDDLMVTKWFYHD